MYKNEIKFIKVKESMNAYSKIDNENPADIQNYDREKELSQPLLEPAVIFQSFFY